MITIRLLCYEDLPALDRLLQQYAQANPPRTVMPAGFYLSPIFEAGQKVMCAFNQAGNLVGYAPYLAQGDLAWAEVMTIPGLEPAPEVKNPLWAWIVTQARHGRQKKVCFQYYPNKAPAIRFVEEQGGQCRYRIFNMRRDLSQPIPALAAPEGFSVRHWRMQREPEQLSYLAGRNACFPEAPTSLEEWQYFTRSPL